MRYGTYTCGLADGRVEYGFTFGQVANEEDMHTTGPCEIGDAEFDVVLGVTDAHSLGAIEPAWANYRWVAEAVVEASKSRRN